MDVGLRRPDLDDVFLTLTGHEAEAPAVDPGSEPTGRKTRAGRHAAKNDNQEALR